MRIKMPSKNRSNADMIMNNTMENMDSSNVIDDINLNETNVNMDKINELKQLLLSKQQGQQQAVPQNKSQQPTMVSYKFGVIGLGHAGSRLAEAFHSLGYDAVALNTATQDLVHINLPEENKLFMDIGIQGAAKDLVRGELAAETYKDKITLLLDEKLVNTDVLIICSSAGGGSGAGALPVVVDICQATNKPIVLMAVLPMISEDLKTKSNSIETVSKLTSYIASGKAHSVILVDNAKIESIYSNVSQMQFYDIANKSIVEPLDVFNTFSMKPSKFKPLDSMEFATLLLDGDGISTYGEIVADKFNEDVDLGKAIIASLQENLLATGLNYTQAKRVGYMVIGNQKSLLQIPTASLTYAHAIIEEMFGSPEATYRGIYIEEDMADDVVKIYTFVSGLGIPEQRIVELQKEVATLQEVVKNKSQDRAKNLVVDTGKTNTLSNIDKIKQQMAAKLSGLGKLNSLNKR